jgi:hypothetical protein
MVVLPSPHLLEPGEYNLIQSPYEARLPIYGRKKAFTLLPIAPVLLPQHNYTTVVRKLRGKLPRNYSAAFNTNHLVGVRVDERDTDLLTGFHDPLMNYVEYCHFMRKGQGIVFLNGPFEIYKPSLGKKENDDYQRYDYLARIESSWGGKRNYFFAISLLFHPALIHRVPHVVVADTTTVSVVITSIMPPAVSPVTPADTPQPSFHVHAE